MRAFVTAATAVLALGVLAACGNSATPTSTGQDSQRSSSQSAKPEPEPPSVIAEPTPPAGKPSDPGSGKPRDPGSGEPPVTIGPNGPVVPAGVTEVPPAQINASGLPTYLEYGNRVWAYDGGFSLQMFAAATSSCTGAEALVTEQASDSVTIVVRPVDGPQGGRPDDGVCATVMTPVPVTVTLDTPLQDRRIVLLAE
jgi:hypothetical protein